MSKLRWILLGLCLFVGTAPSARAFTFGYIIKSPDGEQREFTMTGDDPPRKVEIPSSDWLCTISILEKKDVPIPEIGHIYRIITFCAPRADRDVQVGTILVCGEGAYAKEVESAGVRPMSNLHLYQSGLATEDALMPNTVVVTCDPG